MSVPSLSNITSWGLFFDLAKERIGNFAKLIKRVGIAEIDEIGNIVINFVSSKNEKKLRLIVLTAMKDTERPRNKLAPRAVRVARGYSTS